MVSCASFSSWCERWTSARSSAHARAGGNATPESLISALESMRDYNLGGFFVDFSPTDHTGSKYVDLTILTADGHVRR